MIVLPFPPATLSGHDERHKYAHTNHVKEWRAKACDIAKGGGARAFPDGKPYTATGDIHLTIRFYPPNKRGDRTNFPNRCKPLLDGLADAWGVNDARFIPHFEFHAPEAPGRVEIEVIP